MFLNDPARPSAGDLPFGGALAHPNPRIRRIIGTMAAQIEDPIGLAEIVKSSGMTLRSMVRLFGKELNTTHGQFYLNLRLARARTYCWRQPVDCRSCCTVRFFVRLGLDACSQAGPRARTE